MKGTAIWTALPNGYTEDRSRPRLSVLVSPRFADLTVADPLGPFTDWPGHIGLAGLKFTVQVDGQDPFVDLIPLGWNDRNSVNRASAMWKEAFRNYLGVERKSGSSSMTSLGQPYTSEPLTGIIPSSYQSRDLGTFHRNIFARQNAAISLVKNPSEAKALFANAKRLTDTTTLMTDLNVRLPPDASEQQKLESARTLSFFNDWLPDAAEKRASAAALKAEALASLTAYKNGNGDPKNIGLDLQPWVLAAVITSICRKINVPPPSPPSGLDKAVKKAAGLMGADIVPHDALGEFADFHAKEGDSSHKMNARDCPVLIVDIHSAFSMLGDFPQLERALGIVLDLELPASAVLPPAGVVSAVPQWTTQPAGMVNCYMKTNFTVNSAAKRFFTTPATPFLDQGYVDLRNNAFHLETLDVDSSTYSTLYGNTSAPQGGVPSTDKPVVAPPATAGIAVVFTGKEKFIQTLVDRANKNQATLKTAIDAALTANVASCAGPVLNAEDVFFGVRLDAKIKPQDRAPSTSWNSICYREEKYSFPNSQVPDWKPGNPVEGEIRLGGAQNTTTDPNIKVLRIAPTIARWESHGFGFAAIPQEPLDSTTLKDEDKITCEVPEENRPLAVAHIFSAPQGKKIPLLPQFGEKYKVRLRFVDVAGNSVSPADLDETHALGLSNTEYLPYKRFEPIPPPFPLLWSRLNLKSCPARQLTTLVVREQDSFDRRFIAPPRVQSYVLAKAHQKLLGRSISSKDPGAFVGAQLHSDGTFHFSSEPGADGESVENPIFLYQPSNASLPDVPYLGDPATPGALVLLTDRRHFAFPRDPAQDSLLDAFQAEIGHYYVGQNAWPNSQPFVIELHRAGLPEAGRYPVIASISKSSVLAPFANRVRVELLPGEKVLLKLASRLDSGTPNEAWTEAMALFQNGVDDLAKASGGEMPAISPPLEITLVHAVKLPVHVELSSVGPLSTIPCLRQKGVLVRKADEKKAELVWEFRVHRPSLGRLDLQASWTEFNDQGPRCEQQHNNPILDHHKVELDPVAAHSIPVQQWDLNNPEQIVLVQTFNDTHYRLVTYSAKAVTRYREYYSADSDEKDFSSQTNSVTVPILSTRRPDPPSIHSIVPVFEWTDSTATPHMKAIRRRGVLRVYLNRGWYSSGDGEQLAAVLLDPAISPASISEIDLKKVLAPVITRWGSDPLWKTSPLSSFPTPADFRDGEKPECLLTVPEDTKSYRFKVVAVSPLYDVERKLWRADFSIDPTKSYMPFVRLALTRYQANSIDNCELSSVSLAEFCQLLPDRSASLVYAPHDQRVVFVTVQGISYQSRRGADDDEILEPSRMRVAVEERAGDLGGDLGWHRIELGAVAGGWLNPDAGYPKSVEASGQLEWRFSVHLPQSRKERHYRVVIREDEIYQQEDHAHWNAPSPTSDFGRAVYLGVLGI